MAGPEQNMPGGGGDVLSQSDIDRLMAEAASAVEKAPPIFRHSGEVFPEETPPRVESHDFSNPLAIDEPVLRVLRQKHDEFVSFVSARLSIFLRMDFTLKVQRIAAAVYKRFSATVANPSHVVLFKMDPLAGVGVLDTSLRLGHTIVDRMLGGKGHSVKIPEHMTEIEMNLLDDTLLVILEEWCRMWGSEHKLNPAIVGRESGGRYLQSSASDTVMLVVVLEGSIGDCTERVQIAIPLPSVEGFLRSIAAARVPDASADGRAKRHGAWRPTYNAIPIRMSAEWDACELTLREVIALKAGHVLRLPREILGDTRMRVADATKFIGEVGVEDGRLAIRIDQILHPEDV
ncbi:MAG: FliM/FliN family flagellar motor switch protein [Opitutaceae bacterium]|nr:FliM/FliN family flagellar motor switch protein [Opitutaceae bacterium]